MIQSQLLGLGGVVNSGVLQSLKYKDIPPGDYQGLQVRIIQLEGQVCEPEKGLLWYVLHLRQTSTLSCI